jgi:hypothetical protein
MQAAAALPDMHKKGQSRVAALPFELLMQCFRKLFF